MTVPLVFVALDPLYAADLNDVSDSVVMRCTSGTRPSAPVEGMTIYQTDDNRYLLYNGAAWVTITPVTAVVAASETTTSTSYADLATSGPQVSLQTGTRVLFRPGCRGSTSVADSWFAAPAVSGATTIAAADNGAVAATAAGGYFMKMAAEIYTASLTAGVNTFKLRYRVNGASTGTFLERFITVVGLP